MLRLRKGIYFVTAFVAVDINRRAWRLHDLTAPQSLESCCYHSFWELRFACSLWQFWQVHIYALGKGTNYKMQYLKHHQARILKILKVSTHEPSGIWVSLCLPQGLSDSPFSSFTSLGQYTWLYRTAESCKILEVWNFGNSLHRQQSSEACNWALESAGKEAANRFCEVLEKCGKRLLSTSRWYHNCSTFHSMTLPEFLWKVFRLYWY